MAQFIETDPIMSALSLFSLYIKHPNPTDHPYFIHLLSAESSNHVFLYPNISVSYRHAHDKPGGGQSSVCALHGMDNSMQPKKRKGIELMIRLKSR